MASGRIEKNDIITQAAINTVAELAAEIAKVAKETEELKTILKDAKSLGAVADATKKTTKNTEKLTTATKEFQSIIGLGKQKLKAETDQRVTAAKKVADADKKATDAKKKNTKEWIAAAKRVSVFEKKAAREKLASDKKIATGIKLKIAIQKIDKGSIDRLRAANKILANRMKELNVLIPIQRKQYDRLADSMQRNSNKIREMNIATKKQSSRFGAMMKSVARAALMYIGITKVISFFTTTLFNLTKKLSALEFAMKTVIRDSNELLVTQRFLSQTAANYGQDIVALTERYIKFRAAAQQSNLTSVETMDIFDSMAKAAGVLGLKTDEVNGVFLALEQMISKGKVTTEELRRQLGERLPGAMGIMADSIGVTISELDKMLKAGTVLSAEVLPNFAKAVEIAYGIETITKIENLIAVQGRLTTSWKEFVDELSADSTYISAIKNWSNMFNRFRIVWDDNSRLLEKYQLMTTKTGKAVNSFVEEADKMKFSQLDNADTADAFIKKLDEEGLTLEHATKVWNEYFEVREATSKLDINKFELPKAFDFGDAKSVLDTAEEDLDSFGKLAKGSLRDAFVLDSNVLTMGFESYKKYLQSLVGAARDETSKAKESLDLFGAAKMTLSELDDKLANTTDENEKKRLRDLFKNENNKNRILFQNAENRLAFEIEINNRLADLNKGKKSKGGKDETLTLLKSRQALELEQLKLFLKEKLLAFEGSDDELKQQQFDAGREIIVQRLEDLEEQRTAVGAMTKKELADASLSDVERANIKTKTSNTLLDIEKEYTILEREIIENAIAWKKNAWKDESKDAEAIRNERLDAIFTNANKLKAKAAEDANNDFLDTKRRGKDKIRTMWGLAVAQLSIEHATAIEIQKLYEENTAAWLEQEDIKDNLRRVLAEKAISFEKKLSDEKINELKRVLDFANESVNAAFNIQQQFSDNQLERARNRFERETQLAGDSEAAKLVAKRKFEKEERVIAKRQAKAAKAQAAFNIGLSTAQAIIGIWAQVPKFDFGISAGILTGVVGAIGAAQLAAVLAKPLPFFAEGVKNFEGGPAIVGDKKGNPTKAGGSELGILPGGQMFMTPSTPTVMNLPARTDIIPNDMVASTLANEAMTSTYNMIDMSSTNSHLKRIDKNTSESTTYEGNYKIVRRKGFVGRYRI
jgi:tape measure domain-containing protein